MWFIVGKNYDDDCDCCGAQLHNLLLFGVVFVTKQEAQEAINHLEKCQYVASYNSLECIEYYPLEIA
jgi:hypothetical protein